MKIYNIHKTTGTIRLVSVEADRIHFEPGGSVSFWSGSIMAPVLVMAYAPNAWRSVHEKVGDFI